MNLKCYSFSLFLIQLSFQEWTQQMRDMLDARKRGDFAFRDKDFKAAIDCYSQVGLLSKDEWYTCSAINHIYHVTNCLFVIHLSRYCTRRCYIIVLQEITVLCLLCAVYRCGDDGFSDSLCSSQSVLSIERSSGRCPSRRNASTDSVSRLGNSFLHAVGCPC